MLGHVTDSTGFVPRGSPDSGFENVTGIALGAGGQVAIADGAESVIYLFGSDGSARGVIGRKGSGPGEFIALCCIGLAPDGALWTSDAATRRYSVFALGESGGTFLRAVQMPSNPSGRYDRLAWTSTGQLIHIASSFDSITGSVGLRHDVLDSAGGVITSEAVPEPPADSLSVVTIKSGSASGYGAATFMAPFGAASLHAFGPGDAQAHAVSSVYRVRLVRPGWGDTVVGRALTPPPVNDQERAEGEQLLDQIAKRVGRTRAGLGLEVPRTKPPLCNLGFDLDGRLWVELCQASGQPRAADVYESTGKFLGTWQWPRNVRLSLWAITGEEALGVATDSLGVQRVQRVRFQPTP